MTNPHYRNRNLIRVTFAAIFTTAIAAIWLACAISGFVAVQKTAECDRSPDQNPPSPVLSEPAPPRPTKTPKSKTAKPKTVPLSPPWTTRRKNDVM